MRSIDPSTSALRQSFVEKAPAPELTVIIVSFNTRSMTLTCLRTLLTEIRLGTAEVIVVDNGSSDGSVDAVRAEFPQVQVVASQRNLGFGAANNLAMRQARGQYFLLLNSDAFVRPGAIAAMRKALDADKRLGVVGPRLLNEDGTLQLSCFRFPSPMQAWLENLWIPRLLPHHAIYGDYRGWKHNSARDVDFVIGACLLLRREVVDQVGYFDESFFMYQEEADLQKRIREAGWRIGFTPAAEVVHLGGASGKTEPARINAHFFGSLDRYALKHHGRSGFLLLRAAMVVGCSMRLVAWSVAALAPRWKAVAPRKVRRHAALLWRQLRTGVERQNS